MSLMPSTGSVRGNQLLLSLGSRKRVATFLYALHRRLLFRWLTATDTAREHRPDLAFSDFAIVSEAAHVRRRYDAVVSALRQELAHLRSEASASSSGVRQSAWFWGHPIAFMSAIAD